MPLVELLVKLFDFVTTCIAMVAVQVTAECEPVWMQRRRQGVGEDRRNECRCLRKWWRQVVAQPPNFFKHCIDLPPLAVYSFLQRVDRRVGPELGAGPELGVTYACVRRELLPGHHGVAIRARARHFGTYQMVGVTTLKALAARARELARGANLCVLPFLARR